jgi:hypothetical protein
MDAPPAAKKICRTSRVSSEYDFSKAFGRVRQQRFDCIRSL